MLGREGPDIPGTDGMADKYEGRMDLETCEERAEFLNGVLYGAGAPAVLGGAETRARSRRALSLKASIEQSWTASPVLAALPHA